MRFERGADIVGQAAAADQIRPARESAALAGEEQAACAGAGQCLQRRLQLPDEFRIERIERIRAGEGDRRDGGGALFEPNVGEVHAWIVTPPAAHA